MNLMDSKHEKEVSPDPAERENNQRLESVPNYRIIYSIPISDLSKQGFQHGDIDLCRYRFVDCEVFLDQDILQLVSFESLPSFQYSAISYVWKGFAPLKNDPHPCFQVADAEGADPIHIDMLRDACLLSKLKHAPYLWLDCICIMQGSEEDRNWQIQKMAELYAQCRCCLIFPGGLQRLTRLRWRELTTWNSRHWTLQEAVLPEEAYVVFEWKLGSGKINDQASIHHLRGKTAYGSLKEFLERTYEDSNYKEVFVDTSGRRELLSTSTHWSPSSRLLGSEDESNVMSAFQNLDGDQRALAIWKSIFVRESSRPVDSVLSNMGLLGITLNPKIFATGQDSSLAATIKLAQAYLANGGKAYWLSFLGNITYSNCLYDFSKQWPSLDDRMCIMIRILKGGEQMQPYYRPEKFRPSISEWRCDCLRNQLKNPPGGTMDDLGYLTIVVPSISFAAGESPPWYTIEVASAYCLIDLGVFIVPGYSRNLVLYLATHAVDRWHVFRKVRLPPDRLKDERLSEWRLQQFAIGGPHPVQNLFL